MARYEVFQNTSLQTLTIEKSEPLEDVIPHHESYQILSQSTEQGGKLRIAIRAGWPKWARRNLTLEDLDCPESIDNYLQNPWCESQFVVIPNRIWSKSCKDNSNHLRFIRGFIYHACSL